MTVVDCLFCKTRMAPMSAEQCREFGQLVGLRVLAGIFCERCGVHCVVTRQDDAERVYSLHEGQFIETLVFD